jgi:hypothetical protein
MIHAMIPYLEGLTRVGLNVWLGFWLGFTFAAVRAILRGEPLF